MGVPRTGPCTPWCTGPDIAATPWMRAAAAKWLAGAAAGEDPRTQDDIDAISAEAALAASAVLYELTGRIFTGECGPVTIRPVSRPTDGDTRAWAGMAHGWSGSWGTCSASSYGIDAVGVASHYGCSNPPEIDLGASPISAITEVKIDGQVIPADEYELRDYQTLVRIRPTAASEPTARWGWPTCQTGDLPDTEQGTFSVTYTYGQPPPSSGVLAVKKLAEFLALPQLGDTTKYPGRVTSVQRQGVSAMVVDVMDIVKTGKTGIYEVDLFLRATNPNQAARQAAVWSPDIGRPRRTPTS